MGPEKSGPGDAALRSLLRAVPGAVAAGRLVRDHLFPGIARRRRFADHYARNYWRDGESCSGRGSRLAETEAIRAALPPLCRQLDVRSLLDVPCGDFNWMRRVTLDGVGYVGADIVNALAEANQRRYGQPGRRFVAMDIVRAVPGRFDLILCRDLMGHLPNRDVARCLRNLRRSGSTWLLATTFPGRRRNEDLEGRDWRPVNLQLPPFRLPPPATLITENCPEPGYEDKSLGLWRLAEPS